MDMYGFYTGKIFNAYEFMGAHLTDNGTIFRVYAPNAIKVSVIGDFNNWTDSFMYTIHDNNFYELQIVAARKGMRYKYRIYQNDGRFIDHCDPYGYGMELRPQNSSIISALYEYRFNDDGWMKKRTDNKALPLNIYEIHLGSWRSTSIDPDTFPTYKELSLSLINYVKETGYNCIEIMPICEYPCDNSWGYQALGFFSPTSRYGTMNDLKYFIDQCHQNDISVILDFTPVHFAVDDFGLSDFDGSPLYEYPHRDIEYTEWGSKSFAHSRGEVQSFLQSCVMYWIKEFHFDGIRMDAVSNIVYWMGNQYRGCNQSAITFIKYMNSHIKEAFPSVMLIAEDSTSYPNVTKTVNEGGLGFDYKWDMGWMNDTLEYFKESPVLRYRDYHKLTFSMHYFYSENFLMPFSHDEVVHGKATILQKMNGQLDDKFPQARALYMYMYSHPGKKLNFMGNELGQLREWDETREQDWKLLTISTHEKFNHFIKTLNHFYLKHSSFYELDHDKKGFLWIDCNPKDNIAYSYIRKNSDNSETMLVVLNFSDEPINNYECSIEGAYASLLLDSNWSEFGGTVAKTASSVHIIDSLMSIDLEPYSGKYFLIKNEH